MNEAISERATTIIAGGAATSWAWLPNVQDGLSIILTVLGIAWLSLQIIYKITDQRHKRRQRDVER